MRPEALPNVIDESAEFAAMRTLPNTLLVTCTPPGQNGVGAIILDDLIRLFPSDRLTVAVVDNSATAATDVRHGIRVEHFGRRYRLSGGARFGRVGRALATPIVSSLQRAATSANLVALRSLLAQGQFDRIWLVLSSPWIIDLAAELMDEGVPVVALVWDDVEHNLNYFGASSGTRRRLRAGFDAVMKRAHRIAVIGESMRDEYRARYGRDSVIVRHGLAPALPISYAGSGDLVRIGFAGSVTARSAFDLLLSTLDDMHWRVAARDIELCVMGGRFDLWSRVPRRILCLGWRDVADTVAELSRCTFNYLPQPFESDWTNFASLSFPSKTTTYLAAGAPLLIHAPPHASLPRFVADHPIAHTVDRLDATLLRGAIEDLATDANLRARLCEAGRIALEQVFSPDTFRRSFLEFIDA